MKARVTKEKKQWITDLTLENAKDVNLIINKQNPEWGVQPFKYNAQPLMDGHFIHIWGRGSHSSIMGNEDMEYWGVISFK
ncbi:MAG: hypothetical protein FWF54_00415 [Candidatus Azobacteroides sp.]|nr:hypothetical protein [Candidatus Azobacteroides sp.]